MNIPIELINISSDFRAEPTDIGELALSIQQNGLINPITLKEVDGHYEIMAGRRRFRALRDYLEYKELVVGRHCIIYEKVDIHPLVIQFEENHKRKDFNPVELARLVKDIHEEKQQEHGTAYKGIKGGWSIKNTAALLSSEPTFITRLLKIAENEDLVKNCQTLHEALQTIERATNKTIVDTARKVRVAKTLEQIESLEIEDYISSLQNIDALTFLNEQTDETVDFIHIDPPFAIDIDEVAGSQSYDAYDDKPEEILPLVERVINECYRILKPNCFIVCWCANQYATWLQEAMKKAGFSVSPTLLYWVKTNCSGRSSDPNKRLGSIVEVAVYGWKGNDAELTIKGRGNVFPQPIPRTDRIHVAQKPEELLIDILNIFSLPGGIVLDCFSGSGSTLRACYKTKRQFRGCELSENHYNTSILKTIEWATKQSAA